MRKEIYEEYKQEHPEELLELGKIHEYTARVERNREDRVAAKLKKVAECRERLYGKLTS